MNIYFSRIYILLWGSNVYFSYIRYNIYIYNIYQVTMHIAHMEIQSGERLYNANVTRKYIRFTRNISNFFPSDN